VNCLTIFRERNDIAVRVDTAADLHKHALGRRRDLPVIKPGSV
jgi:hypothetical protein